MNIPQTATNAWHYLLHDILKFGAESSPRDIKTIELNAYQSLISMQDPIVLTAARGLNYRFMAAEAWWILSGLDDAASIGEYCKNIMQYADQDGGARFFGAYGPKIVAQLDYVVDKLVRDQTSRQAVINIWRENPPETRDIPCTLSAQWMIRNGALHCIDTMRSSDAWLGWPYDVFNFSMISWHILERLRAAGITLELGCLMLNAGSQHLYDHDAAKISRWNEHTLEACHPFENPAGVSPRHQVCVVDELLGCLKPNEGMQLHPFFAEFMRLIETSSKK